MGGKKTNASNIDLFLSRNQPPSGKKPRLGLKMSWISRKKGERGGNTDKKFLLKTGPSGARMQGAKKQVQRREVEPLGRNV